MTIRAAQGADPAKEAIDRSVRRIRNMMETILDPKCTMAAAAAILAAAERRVCDTHASAKEFAKRDNAEWSE